MLTFRESDEESQEYRLASSRTPSPTISNSNSEEDWINTPAFKWRAQQRRLKAETEYKYSNTPLASLDSKFNESIDQINASLDSFSVNNWKNGWNKFLEKQKELQLFQVQEYESLMCILKDLENSNIELQQQVQDLKLQLNENLRFHS